MPDDPPRLVDGGADGGIGHLINTKRNPTCPHCGADAAHFHVENYDPIWMDGDVMCGKCGKRVRTYDAG